MNAIESSQGMHAILWKKFHSEGRRQYDLHCPLSAMSSQAAVPEEDSEEKPLKPTNRQAINSKIKKLRDLKEKSEKLKSSIQTRECPAVD